MKKIQFKDKRPLILLAPEKIIKNPNQPRKEMSPLPLSSLAISLKENGMMQPLTVRKTTEGYLLIAGHRRLEAALQIGMKRVPCMVAKVSPGEAAVMTLLENLQRERLTFWEEALGIQQLIENWNLTPEDAAARLGISCNALAQKLQLLTFTPWQKERLQLAKLQEAHAHLLLKIPDEEKRNDCILKVIANQLTPHQTAELVDKLLQEEQAPPVTRKTLLSDLRLLENTINHAVTTMNRGGMKTTTQKTETDFFVEYTLHVEKNKEESTETSQLSV